MPSKFSQEREGDASGLRPAASRPEDEAVVTAHGPRARAAITSAEQRWLVFGGFAFSAVLFFVVYQPWNLSRFMVAAPVGRDFVNFWTGGYLALQGQLDLLVDFAGYNDFIAATFPHDNPFDERVFSYPPHILLFLVPFATLPIVPAVFLWTALNVWLIGRSVRLLARDEPALRLAACLSPAVVTMVAFGHFGGALAFLATYVLTRTDARPHIAGICLALMSVKPQLALAFGIFLLFTGRWRAVLWSLPATACLVGLSVAAFGVKPWINFVEWTMPFHVKVLSLYVHEVLRTVVSLYSAARLMGFSASVGYGLQYAYGMVVLIGAAALAVRCGMTPRVVAIALLAVLASLPYFANYDLAIITPALTVAMFRSQPDEDRPFLTIVPASLLWMAPVSSAAFDAMSLPVVSLAIAAVLLLAMYRQAVACRRATPSAQGFAAAARAMPAE
jgi:hypothetical protein